MQRIEPLHRRRTTDGLATDRRATREITSGMVYLAQDPGFRSTAGPTTDRTGRLGIAARSAIGYCRQLIADPGVRRQAAANHQLQIKRTSHNRTSTTCCIVYCIPNRKMHATPNATPRLHEFTCGFYDFYIAPIFLSLMPPCSREFDRALVIELLLVIVVPVRVWAPRWRRHRCARLHGRRILRSHRLVEV